MGVIYNDTLNGLGAFNQTKALRAHLIHNKWREELWLMQSGKPLLFGWNIQGREIEKKMFP